MKILEGKELKEARKYIEKAVEISKKSVCQVSKIGSVIVKDGKIIGQGFSGPADQRECDPCILKLMGKNTKTELCYAMHAGERAIMDALKRKGSSEGARLYTAKTKNGKIIPYKNGLCASCSRLFLESGIVKIVFSDERGVVSYDVEEFYELSFDNFVKEKFIL